MSKQDLGPCIWGREFNQFSYTKYSQMLVNDLMKLFDKFSVKCIWEKNSSISDSLKTWKKQKKLVRQLLPNHKKKELISTSSSNDQWAQIKNINNSCRKKNAIFVQSTGAEKQILWFVCALILISCNLEKKGFQLHLPPSKAAGLKVPLQSSALRAVLELKQVGWNHQSSCQACSGCLT